MAHKLTIEKILEDWWGIDSLIENMPTATEAERQTAIIELLQEDVCAAVLEGEGGTWKVVEVPDTQEAASASAHTRTVGERS